MDAFVTRVLIVFGGLIFLFLAGVILVLSDEIRRLENKIHYVEQGSCERENRMLNMYAGTTDAIQHIEDELKNKEDRWDAGKSYSACQDWDEHK